MRLASLGALPVIGLADRFGRRMLLLVTVGAGLAMTARAAASPSYRWFVAIAIRIPGSDQLTTWDRSSCSLSGPLAGPAPPAR